MENKKRLKKIIEYIEDNLDNQLNLDDIAKEAAYSKFHLNRSVFRVCWLHYLSIYSKAQTHCSSRKTCLYKKPIIEIAYEANYSSQESFTYAFRQLYGWPPARI